MQDSHDEGRGGMEEAEVGFGLEEVGLGGRAGGPEEGVVVGEEGEEDAEEEGGCWVGRVSLGERWDQGCVERDLDLRQTIRKVANARVGMMREVGLYALVELADRRRVLESQEQSITTSPRFDDQKILALSPENKMHAFVRARCARLTRLSSSCQLTRLGSKYVCPGEGLRSS